MTKLGWDDGSRIRFWGDKGSLVIAIHGGPGAVGDMGDLSSAISNDFHVIEPWQRISGKVSINVNQHIEDLHNLILNHCKNEKPVLVGHSWGAMLALAYASAYPETVRAITLVGCGTFDEESRSVFKQTVEDRKVPDFDEKTQQIEKEFSDLSERMKRTYDLISKAYDVDLISSESSMTEPFDFLAHKDTWADMVRLMNAGKYPQKFIRIKLPVAMFHGDYDPHPGKMIYENLLNFMPHLEYFEFSKCGHSPWKEKHARDQFFDKLKCWLFENSP